MADTVTFNSLILSGATTATTIIESIVWQDDFSDDTYWSESDPDDNGIFNGTNYVWNCPPGENGPALSAYFDIGGLWEMELDFNLIGFTGTPTGGINPDSITFNIDENVGKGGNTALIGIRGTGLGGWEYFLKMIINFVTVNLSFGTPGIGNHRVKLRKNADLSVTCFVWNNSQWEWDGDTDGYTSGQDWNIDSSSVFAWAVNLSGHEGSLNLITLYTGTFTP